MSTVTSGITIGIILFIIIMIPIFIFIILPRFANKFCIKTNFIIIGAYFALLVAMSLIFLCFPSNVLIKSDNQAATIENVDYINQFYIKAKLGDFSAPNGFEKAGNYSFRVQNSNVSFEINSGSASFYVGTKGEDVPDNGNGKIDVCCYIPKRVKINYSGVNFSFKIQAPTVKYKSNVLAVNNASQKSRDIYKFDDGYAAQQFFGNDDSFSMTSTGDEMIVVLLPKGVTAIGNDFTRLSVYEQ